MNNNPRHQHLLQCIRADAASAGAAFDLTVVSSPEDLEPPGQIAVWNYPAMPPESWRITSRFSLVLFGSSDSKGRFAPIPVDLRLLDQPRGKAPWLDWGRSGFRLYTLVPPHEIGLIFPVVSAYLREYRSSDDVSLTLWSWAGAADVEAEVHEALSRSSPMGSRRARLHIHTGPWDAEMQAVLHRWGDACLLPWAGCDAPIEAVYAMGAGNLVIATGWGAAGTVTARTGLPLGYSLENTGVAHAKPDWVQFEAGMRLAVGNGRRKLTPAIQAAKLRDCQTGNFSKFLMSVYGNV